jgi:hypothetical protein
MFDKLLSKFGVQYEDLNTLEKETLTKWLENLSTKQLTVDSIKEHVTELIIAVEKELSAYDLPKEKDLFLKARLKNYLLLQDFLTSPDKAQKHIEESLKNIK